MGIHLGRRLNERGQAAAECWVIQYFGHVEILINIKVNGLKLELGVETPQRRVRLSVLITKPKRPLS